MAPITAPPAAPIPAPDRPRSPTVSPQPERAIAATKRTGIPKRVFIVIILPCWNDGRKDDQRMWLEHGSPGVFLSPVSGLFRRRLPGFLRFSTESQAQRVELDEA